MKPTTLIVIVALGVGCLLGVTLADMTPDTRREGTVRQAEGNVPLPVPELDSLDERSRAPLDHTGDSIPSTESTPAPKQRPVATEEGVHSWAQAKLEMRADFLVSEDNLKDFSRSILTVSHNAGDFRRLMGPLLVSASAEPSWDEIWTTPNGYALSDLQKQDMTTLVQHAAPPLTEAAQQAEALLQDSLLHYWEHDRGFKYLESQGFAWPEGYFNPKGGAYNYSFEALAGGWKMAVNFDSSEYEVLEAQLREAFRQKTELYNGLVTVANGK